MCTGIVILDLLFKTLQFMYPSRYACKDEATGKLDRTSRVSPNGQESE